MGVSMPLKWKYRLNSYMIKKFATSFYVVKFVYSEPINSETI